jgi:Uma2 family endonuclease
MVSGGRSMVARPRAHFLATDIWDTPDDGNRYEVIDGELYVTPPPIREHQHSSGQLQGTLWRYLQDNPIGLIYAAPFGVIIDTLTGMQPDLVYVSNERAAILTHDGIEGTPDLVVEILSPSTQSRDLGIKLRRYEAAGVPHYWILDPRARTLVVRDLGRDGYGEPVTYGSGEVFRPTLFPGLEIEVARLWL